MKMIKINQLEIGQLYECRRITSEIFDELFYGRFNGGTEFITGEDSHSGKETTALPFMGINSWGFIPLKYAD